MKYVDFLAKIDEAKAVGIRAGQAMMIIVAAQDGMLYDKLEGSEMDAAYDNDRIPALIDVLLDEGFLTRGAQDG